MENHHFQWENPLFLQIFIWKIIIFNGKIHCFYSHFQQQTIGHYQRERFEMFSLDICKNQFKTWLALASHRRHTQTKVDGGKSTCTANKTADGCLIEVRNNNKTKLLQRMTPLRVADRSQLDHYLHVLRMQRQCNFPRKNTSPESVWLQFHLRLHDCSRNF